MINKSDKSKSCHIFVFPFKWDFKPKRKSLDDIDFSKRTSIEDFHKILPSSEWKEINFKIKSSSDFNEYNYFYDFARKALSLDKNDSIILKKYEYILKPNSNPIYKIKTFDSPKPYELKIEKILLTTYFTGVGVLSFHLNNYRYSKLQDILLINEFGRRIYPQFLAKNNEGLTKNAKKAFLADMLEIIIDPEKTFKEDFSSFDNIDNVNRNPNMIPNTIMGLLGNRFHTGSLEEKEDRIIISPILDDRMFVLCWLADKALCEALAEYNKENGTYRYGDNDDWYKLVFVDKEYPYCTSIPMKRKLLTDHTYDRWIGANNCSLFGVTRYSFILLTDNFEAFVKRHIKTMYFRMVKLALVQQASILRFSAEATRIADIIDKNKPNYTTEQVGILQKKYLQFINKIYFREVTAFDQGIELYEKILEVMKIDRHVKELDQEIEELRHYASLQEERYHNRQLRLLTILGSLFLLPTFITGYFGMNIFSDRLKVSVPNRLNVIIGSIVLVSLLSLLFLLLSGKKEFCKKLLFIIILLILTAVLVLLISGYLFTLIGV